MIYLSSKRNSIFLSNVIITFWIKNSHLTSFSSLSALWAHTHSADIETNMSLCGVCRQEFSHMFKINHLFRSFSVWLEVCCVCFLGYCYCIDSFFEFETKTETLLFFRFFFLNVPIFLSKENLWLICMPFFLN